MRACVLFIFVFICFVQCQDITPFLNAFPNRDVKVFGSLPKEVFVNEDHPHYAQSSFTACPAILTPPDTNNVNNLKPGNIKVVMAIGDSIIAAMSAKDTNILSLKEYRGLSFCIGGDPGNNTFPNILRQYSPSLIGVSNGIGTRTSNPLNGLNGAVSGAINSDMPAQAEWLVQQLKANRNINIDLDWKVLTLWIGSNNLCAVCNNAAANNGLNFEQNINKTLDYLFKNVPRLFVNLVANLDISTLYNVNGGTCSVLHSFECSCVGTSDASKRAQVSVAAQDYIARAFKIAQYFRTPTQAVVVQPFLTKNIISERSLLSAADCFHPSAAGHDLASTALWNNMLTNSANKKTAWDKNDVPICATVESFFPTN